MPQIRKTLPVGCRSSGSTPARSMSVSLHPHHVRLLSRRESELNLGRSVIVQLLLEADQRLDLVRKELLSRIPTATVRDTPSLP
jgi:hypothetical protein